jgi:hypothetical protein
MQDGGAAFMMPVVSMNERDKRTGIHQHHSVLDLTPSREKPPELLSCLDRQIRRASSDTANQVPNDVKGPFRLF